MIRAPATAQWMVPNCVDGLPMSSVVCGFEGGRGIGEGEPVLRLTHETFHFVLIQCRCGLILCQFDRAARCPDIRSNVILGVPVRAFLDEVHIRISRLNKADHPPQRGRGSSNQLGMKNRRSLSQTERKEPPMNPLPPT